MTRWRCRGLAAVLCVAASVPAAAGTAPVPLQGPCDVPDPPPDCDAIEGAPVLAGGTGRGYALDALATIANRRPARDKDDDEDHAGAGSPYLLAAAAGVGLAGLWEEAASGAHWVPWLTLLRAGFGSRSSGDEYDATLRAAAAGLERVSPLGHAAGLALGMEQLDAALRSEGMQEDAVGGTAVLYGQGTLGRHGFADAALAYTRTRVRRRSAEQSPERARFSGHRAMATANLGRAFDLGSVLLVAHLGALAAREWQPQHQATDTDGSALDVASLRLELAQVNAGGEISAYLGAASDLVLGGVWRRDFHREDQGRGRGDPSDRDEFEAQIGLRYFSSSGFSASVNYVKVLDRSKFFSDTVQLTVRLE